MTLSAKQKLFARLLPRLLDKAHELGFEVTGGEWWRSKEQAAENAAAGTGIAKSLHIKKLAIDFDLWRGGKVLTLSEPYQPLGVWWEAQSTPDCTLCWGGRFKDRFGRPRPDGRHFSMEHEGVR